MVELVDEAEEGADVKRKQLGRFMPYNDNSIAIFYGFLCYFFSTLITNEKKKTPSPTTTTSQV